MNNIAIYESKILERARAVLREMNPRGRVAVFDPYFKKDQLDRSDYQFVICKEAVSHVFRTLDLETLKSIRREVVANNIKGWWRESDFIATIIKVRGGTKDKMIDVVSRMEVGRELWGHDFQEIWLRVEDNDFSFWFMQIPYQMDSKDSDDCPFKKVTLEWMDLILDEKKSLV